MMLLGELHLGAPLPEWGPLGEPRRALLKSALEEAMQLAVSKNVDAVLCSGDLFDQGDPDVELTQFALSQFAEVLEIGARFILLPGRYDSLIHPKSFYREDHPKDICVVNWARGKRTEIQTKSGPFQLYSLAWRAGITPGNIWDDLRRDESAPGPHVGLLHAHAPWSRVPLANGLSVTQQGIASTGLDLLVLGGPHNFHSECAGRTEVVAPGTPTGLGFGEWGERTWCFVDLQDGEVELETVVRDVPSVERTEVEIQPSWSRDTIIKVIDEKVGDGCLVELHLTGQSASPLTEETALEAIARKRCVVDLIDEVDLLLPDHSSTSIRDIFLRRMQERIGAAPREDQAVLRRALKRGMKLDLGGEMIHAD